MLKDQEEFLKKLKFRGKGTPHRTTAVRKGALGIGVVNEVLRAPTRESVCFALSIVKSLYIYEDMLSIPRYSLDKALVSLCDRIFVESLYNEIEERIKKHLHDNPDPSLEEVMVGYFIIKFRKYGVFDNRATEMVGRVSEKLRNKAKKAFGALLDSIGACELEKKVREIVSSGEHLSGARTAISHFLTQRDIEYIRNSYPIVSLIYQVPDLNIPHYHLRNHFNVEYFIGIKCWNAFVEAGPLAHKHGSLGDLCFYLFRNRMYDLGMMYEFVEQATSFERAFAKGYLEMVRQRFKLAREAFRRALEILVDLRMGTAPEILLCVYDLLSLSHLFCGEYFECIFYLDKGMIMAHANQLGFVESYFLDCKLIAERIGNIHGPRSRLEFSLNLESSVEQSVKIEEDRIMNNRVYANVLLERETNDFREIRTLEDFTAFRPITLSTDIQRVLNLFPGYDIISLYCIDGDLFVNNFKRFVRIGINFIRIKERVDEILAHSRNVLKRKIVTDTDKAMWWMERVGLDTRLGDILHEVSNKFDQIELGGRIILVLDETTTEFPFESMPVLRNKAVYRVPSLECLEGPSESMSAGGSVFYLLDPENNLHKTQETISEFLNSVDVNNGVAGRMPSVTECKKASDSDIVLYFGHGNGSKYLRPLGVRNKVVFLFGCNSAKLLCVKNYKRNGSLLRYVSANSMVLGCLWEITDRDIDRFSVKVIGELVHGCQCLGELVSRCRNDFKMRYLNGASVVVYGVPRPIRWNPR